MKVQSSRFEVQGSKFVFPFVFALLSLWASPLQAQPLLGEFEEQAIHYEADHGFADPVMRLQQQLTNGTAKLAFRGEQGFLHDLLQALRVPVASQTLVFSKTSSQRALTSPRTPRALYFNDEVSVGWVPGSSVIDLAAVDPERGTVFYTLDQVSNTAPKFVRRNDCLQCHLGPKTIYVPGWIVRSVYTSTNGTPLGAVEGFAGGHQAPLASRWGGWYVTGRLGGARHLGNLFATNSLGSAPLVGPTSPSLDDLRSRFDTSPYLSSQSDVVALLVLEHELRVQNLIAHANYETRFAMAEWAESLESATATAWPRQRLVLAGEMLIEGLLFRDEAPLEKPIAGSSGFAAEFAAAGPRTADGHSLRDFDLHTRLFKYPCSFMIYSPAFDALPQPTKDYVWQRLEQILTGRDLAGDYASLSAQDRRDVLAILQETKPEFRRWLHTVATNP